jgi:hypothetical protein
MHSEQNALNDSMTSPVFADRVLSVAVAASNDTVALGLGKSDGRLLILDKNFVIKAGVWLGRWYTSDVYHVAFYGNADTQVLCMVDGYGLAMFDYSPERGRGMLTRLAFFPCDEFALRYPQSTGIAITSSRGPAVRLMDKYLSPLSNNLLCKNLLDKYNFGSGMSVAWRANKVAVMLTPQSHEWTANEGIVVVTLNDDNTPVAQYGRRIAKERTMAMSPQWYEDFLLYFTMEGVFFVDSDLRCIRRVRLPVCVDSLGRVVRATVHPEEGCLACLTYTPQGDKKLLMMEFPFDVAEPVAGEPRSKRKRQEPNDCVHTTKAAASTTISTSFMPYLWRRSRLIGTKDAWSSVAQMAIPCLLWRAVRKHVLVCRPAALWWQEYTAQKLCNNGGRGRMEDLCDFRDSFVDRDRPRLLWEVVRKHVLVCRPAAVWWQEYTVNGG